MRSFDLIAFDLDGTVYPSPMEQEPSARVTRAFEAAHAAGVTIAVASGRPAWMIGRQLEQAAWLDWRILANGSRVMPSRGGDAGLSLPLPAADARELMDVLAGLGGIFAIHTQAESFIDQRKAANYAEQQNEILDGSGQVGTGGRRLNPIDAAAALTMTMVGSSRQLLEETPGLEVFKLDCTLPDEEVAAQARAQLEEMGRFSVATLGPTEVEVSRAGVSKGAGLGWLCEHIGIDEARAVAFGDSGNDLSMTGRAATFVAMGNATPEIKEVADDVCDTVRNDGVAQWIEARL